LKDQAPLDRITTTRDEASSILEIKSTPTLFINGEMIEGSMADSEFEAKFRAIQHAQ
jgi:protein-disulfide isomerase